METRQNIDLYAMLQNNIVKEIIVFDKDVDTVFVQEVCEHLLLDNFIKVDNTVRVGYTWNTDHFESPKPYDSWTWFNGVWNAPIEMPLGEEGIYYVWNEEQQSWEQHYI
jgi:hypothetical protein